MQNDRIITISGAGSRRAGRWPAQELLLSAFYDRLRQPVHSTETMAEYLALPKGQQDERKDVGGFVGGLLRDEKRKAGAVVSRDLITLDLDHIPAGGTQEVLRRLVGLGCGYGVYSTRKHMAQAPRLRVVLPLDHSATAEQSEAIARKLAQIIGMELCDASTFEPSRLMYWPSCCSDGEYVFQAEDKPMLSVDGVLGMYPNWQDVSTWPQVPGRELAPHAAKRQGDPTEKPGVVGAFCRIYDVPGAMAVFLPGEYEPVDAGEGRYTYTGGSTAGGAVLYEGGKFLFSHHATDPAGGRLCNAFDLVRLHRFGDLDDDAKADTPVNRMPSFEAMKALALEDKQVAGLLLEERWRSAAEEFGQVGQGADDGEWRGLLRINGQGMPEKSMKNLLIILKHEPRLKGKLRLNLFSGQVDVDGQLPWERPSGAKAWGDEDIAQLRIFLEPLCGKFAKTDVLDAVAACASDQAYHPIKDYLAGLCWDKVPRLDALFVDYLGAANTPYVRAVTRKAFVAAVARVFRPGIKYDTMPVLVGAQGRHKSTILAKMGGEYFSDSLRTFGDKDAMETIQGTWINEVAEMSAMHNSDINAAKAFLTKERDYYRAAYGHYTAVRPRQCVFFGTTNSKECLVDTSGGRRFWPVDIDVLPRSKNVFSELEAERDQLWAEAVAYFHQGEPLHLPKELEELARAAQEEHRQQHPWEGLIADFLEQEVPENWARLDPTQRQMFTFGGGKSTEKLVPRWRVCAAEIWCEVLSKQRGDLQQRNTREINSLLALMPGWESVGLKDAGKPYGKQRCYQRKAVTDEG